MDWLNPLYDFLGLIYEPMFMRRSALALLLLSLASSGAGVLVVNRRMAFYPDAVGHSIFAGLALGLVLNLDPKVSVLGFGLLIGLVITYLIRHSHLASDTVIGLVFSGAVAGGLALVSRWPQVARGLTRYFLGDVLTVGDGDILALMALDLVGLIIMAVYYNPLTLACVSPAGDPKGRAGLADYIYGAYLAMVVMVSVQAVGVLLVTALLVAPAASGRVVAVSGWGMFWAALVVAIVSGQVGLYVSYQPAVNTAAGATVVLVTIMVFVLASVWRLVFKGKIR